MPEPMNMISKECRISIITSIFVEALTGLKGGAVKNLRESGKGHFPQLKELRWFDENVCHREKVKNMPSRLRIMYFWGTVPTLFLGLFVGLLHTARTCAAQSY